jgi:thiamine biosynthesis lipoprotein
LVASWRFDAIGTSWVIDTPVSLGESLAKQVSNRIDAFDRAYSRFRPDSLLSRVAHAPGEVTLPSDSVALFHLYRDLYQATRGALSPLVGSALDHWGYGPGYRLTALPGPPPPIPPFDEVVSLDGTTLTAHRPVSIDIGAAGKGFLVDQVAELLIEAKAKEFTIDASGDIRHRGSEPERIALEHSGDPSRAVGVAHLVNRSLAASAPNRRSWAPGVHHILDALTGLPTAGIQAAFVVADTAGLADGHHG